MVFVKPIVDVKFEYSNGKLIKWYCGFKCFLSKQLRKLYKVLKRQSMSAASNISFVAQWFVVWGFCWD